MADPVPEVLAALETLFSAERIRWYLFGAQAAVLWGTPRTSIDVDVTIEIELCRVPALIERLEQFGFELRVSSGVEEFVRRARVLPFLHAPTRTLVDIVLAGPGLEERFLERAVIQRIGGHPIPVLSPEDVIVTKVLAGRPKDVEDVRGILRRTHEDLDLGQVREALRLLEEALGQSDLLPLLEAELARASDRS